MKEIDEIKARLAAATERPWSYSVMAGTDQPATLYSQTDETIEIAEFEVWDAEFYAPEQIANAELIVNAPTDIATLIEALELYQALEENSWDLRCINVPTGGDDYDILWAVIEHYQAEPKERDIGQGKTPAEAIKEAINTLKASE